MRTLTSTLLLGLLSVSSVYGSESTVSQRGFTLKRVLYEQGEASVNTNDFALNQVNITTAPATTAPATTAPATTGAVALSGGTPPPTISSTTTTGTLAPMPVPTELVSQPLPTSAVSSTTGVITGSIVTLTSGVNMVVPQTLTIPGVSQPVTLNVNLDNLASSSTGDVSVSVGFMGKIVSFSVDSISPQFSDSSVLVGSSVTSTNVVSSSALLTNCAGFMTEYIAGNSAIMGIATQYITQQTDVCSSVTQARRLLTTSGATEVTLVISPDPNGPPPAIAAASASAILGVALQQGALGQLPAVFTQAGITSQPSTQMLVATTATPAPTNSTNTNTTNNKSSGAHSTKLISVALATALISAVFMF